MMITSISAQNASIHTAVRELNEQREFKWNVDRQTDGFSALYI